MFCSCCNAECVSFAKLHSKQATAARLHRARAALRAPPCEASTCLLTRFPRAQHSNDCWLVEMQMAPWAGGEIDTLYRRVACTPVSSLVVDVDANACAYGWLRLGVTVIIWVLPGQGTDILAAVQL